MISLNWTGDYVDIKDENINKAKEQKTYKKSFRGNTTICKKLLI